MRVGIRTRRVELVAVHHDDDRGARPRQLAEAAAEPCLDPLAARRGEDVRLGRRDAEVGHALPRLPAAFAVNLGETC